MKATEENSSKTRDDVNQRIQTRTLQTHLKTTSNDEIMSSNVALSSTSILPPSTNGPKKLNIFKKPSSSNQVSCALRNGVLCKFGCVSRMKCKCPEVDHVLASNGACVEKSTKSLSMCLSKRDVNATWDPRVRVLHIYSHEVFNEVKERESADKVFLEFGRVKEAKTAIGRPTKKVPFDGYVFETSPVQRNRMVVRRDVSYIRKCLSNERSATFICSLDSLDMIHTRHFCFDYSA
ncbi:unnamed protein product [Anisakis simplex]|uniref:RRM domain-containing protein n=1 Tax=Anisakis simplex TaxID=6269 RepID=A0A0M3JBK2_ANISI|nr:unnamed protein product [Anisakis simplex]